ncbi:YraN family protein [Salinimonas iocasae]|uniref:UPF0102 protein FBQ74_04135 n=1 Tax=Salinimonas iocasae TaxID=2572577 RepID=A0A5B7YBP3_9ALTE|nr:YraN family protein [Salinimonas iocasae]QCZ92713.1 YraN family protein [Salinimonas iocasae]
MSRLAGQQAEDKAESYLLAQGLKTEARNFQTRYGELDIVMRDGQTWVCVEVKARRSSSHGVASEFVTASKYRKLQTCFEQFLLAHGLNPNHTSMRLDVVALDNQNLQWIKNIAG